MFSYKVFEELCKEKGESMYQIAQATGVTTSTLSSWHMGRYTPKLDKIQILADHFGVSVERFLEDDGKSD